MEGLTMSDTSIPTRPSHTEPPGTGEPVPPHGAGRSFSQTVAGAVLLLLGAAWLLDQLDMVELRAAYVLPGLLTIVGLALVVGSLRRQHGGLIALGTILTVFTVFAAVTPSESLRGGLGQRDYVINDEADLAGRYELAVGDMNLDLSRLRLTSPTRVRVAIGTGDLTVILPVDADVSVTATTGAGQIRMLDEEVDGLAVKRTYRTPAFSVADNPLELELEMGAGSIEVRPGGDEEGDDGE
jgi:hypothetical protein